MNKEVENAKQCIKNSCEGLALETIEKYYNKKIERLNNRINELEKYLIEKIEYMKSHSIERMITYDDCLDKLKKLKEKSDIDC